MAISKIGTNGLDQSSLELGASGNVGIGTSNPTAKLTVASGGTFRLYRTDNGIYGDTTYVAGTGFVLNDANSDGYSYQQGGSTVFRIATGGNVGIGTSSPVMDGNGSLYVSAINSNGGTFNAGASQSGTANFVGSMQFVNTVLGTTDKRIASIAGVTNGATNSGALTFNTWNSGSGAERMRLNSLGSLLVGTTSNLSPSNGGICIAANYNGTAQGIIDIGHGSSITTGTRFAGYSWNGTIIGEVVQNGTTGVSYITSSDYRLKENIAPMTGALEKVSALKPCTYTWKLDGSSGQGFIAHELAEVVPECVTGEKDAVNEDGSIKPQGIDTSFLVATLTAAIQELKAEFDEYKRTHP